MVSFKIHGVTSQKTVALCVRRLYVQLITLQGLHDNRLFLQPALKRVTLSTVHFESKHNCVVAT